MPAAYAIRSGFLVTACAAILAVPAAAQGRSAPVASGIIAANIDAAVSPRRDLFEHANGTWLRTVAIPPDKVSYGVQQLMIDQVRFRQRSIAEAAIADRDPEARKVGALYASFMDERRIQSAGLAPLRAELTRIERIADRRDLARALGRLDRLGMTVPISTYVAPDAKDASRYALWLSQNDLSLPGREYYLEPGEEYRSKRAALRDHVAALLRLSGDAAARQNADAIVALETAIARLQWAPVDRRDPQKTYNPRSRAALVEMTPDFDWAAYFDGKELGRSQATIVARQPDYLAGVARLSADMPIQSWKAYLRYLLLSGTAPYLPARYADAHFGFTQGVLRGAEAPPERWIRAASLVDRLLGEAAGKLYADRHFSPASKARAEALVANLFTAYRARIEASDWMAPETRAAALAKLSAMTVKIGHPSRWRDYSALSISADDLIGNVLRAQAFEFDRQHRRVGAAVDRAEWQMTVPTPDAYFAPQTNEIVFPAGILQPPLFDAEADDAFNYGSTGATIGHEMSHGFDSRGSRYDAAGNLRDWWTAADRERFEAEAAKLVSQFDGFEPLPGLRVNGRLVLAESIADLAGLSVAWQAYLMTLNGREPPVIDGLTGAQRFFIAYAQSYLGKRRDDAMRALVTGNPHPPERYRVNGIVVHLDAFAAAFGVKPGDPMYLPGEQRARLW